MDATEGKPGKFERQLATVFSDPERRKALASDPQKALADAGIDSAALPEGLRSTLFGLSHGELEAISRVKQGLDDAGVSREDQGEIF